MNEAVIVEAVRSPIGRRKGAFVNMHSVDLHGIVLRELISRAGIDSALVDDHIAGCCTQVREQAFNTARMGWLAGGLAESTPSVTVDRQCGSSQQAVSFAAQRIRAGSAHLVVASGVEHMTHEPLDSDKLDGDPFGPLIEDRYGFPLLDMGYCADMIAHEWRLTRDEQDDFGYRSHVLAGKAYREGYLKRQIVPIEVTSDEGTPFTLERDEGVRLEPRREKMADLQSPFFDAEYEKRFPGKFDWTVTAGNASQITDGAAAVLVASREMADKLGLQPRALIHTEVVVGSDPVLQLTGPIPSTRQALEKAGLSLSDIDVVEINEAFASVVLAWKKELGIDSEWFEEHVNPNGGAIACGHPLGASGARIMTDLLNELERRQARYGLQTMCAAYGTSNTTIIERLG